jgi:hypothetical protein
VGEVRKGEWEGGWQLENGAVAEVNLLVEAHLSCQLWWDRGNLGNRKKNASSNFELIFQSVML